MRYVLVLAGDPHRPCGTLGPNTLMRCEAALSHAEKQRARGESVTFILAAGRGEVTERGDTVAMQMRAWLRKRSHSFRYLTNERDDHVWSTLGEMRWAARALGEIIPEDLAIVSTVRHLRRVEIIRRWFVSLPPFQRVSSSEVPPPWWHEALGYAKLIACYARFESSAEKFRRRYYRVN